MATRKSFDKERWEAMTGMEMSQLLPECENPESAGEVTDHAGNEILPTVTEQSGIQEPAEKDGSAPASKCRIRQATQAVTGRVPQHIPAGSQNRRPQARIRELRGKGQAGRVCPQARKPQDERVRTAGKYRPAAS